VRGTEEWPDRTVSARYGFLHALYQEVMYERVTAGRLSSCIGRLASAKMAAYGTRASEIARRLAVHFERGEITAERAVSPACGGAGHPAECASGGDQSPHERTRTAQDFSGYPRAHPARTHVASYARCVVDGHLSYGAPEVERATSGPERCASRSGSPSALSSTAGLWVFFLTRAGVPHGRD